jgi:hypothetical protein
VAGSPAQPAGLKIRSLEGGNFTSFAAGRIGRRTNSPPQLGHRPLRMLSAQLRQNVHSNEQIVASAESGGRSRSQHSQLGLSESIVIPFEPVALARAFRPYARCLRNSRP